MAEGAAREVGDLLGTGVWMIVVRRASYVDSWRFARARAAAACSSGYGL